MELFVVGLLIVLAIPLVISIRRSTQLFVVRVRGGKARFVRGRMPGTLLHDIQDVVRDPVVEQAEILAVLDRGVARLVVRGGEIPASQMQQLRNVLGTYTLARIKAGSPPARG